jgi:hypothetical protein
MPFLLDLANLTRRANTAAARMDVGASLATAQQTLERAGRVMAASVVAHDPALEAARVRATATVADARQLAVMVGMHAVVYLELIVSLPGGIPMPASRAEQLAPLHLARVAPGSQVPVSLVPGRPETVRIEWAA